MKKRLCLLLAVLLMICSALPAFAAAGKIDDSSLNLKGLRMDVAVSGGSENLSFYGSVDGSEPVLLEAEKVPDSEIGHIIVVDLGWTWTKYITWETLLPAINTYLNTIPSGQQVMFVLAEAGGATPTNYMTVAMAKAYVSDNIVLPATPASVTGKASNTSIDSALSFAFTKATETGGNVPTFKNVFALVDPGSSGIGSSAIKVREEYRKTGNAFPVLIATVYPESFMESSSSSEAGKQITKGISHYNSFAKENDSVLVRLNYRTDEALPTSNITTMQVSRSYYTLDLTPLHALIDYSAKTHEIVVVSSDGRTMGDGTAFTGILTNALPTALPTATPTEAPTETPAPEITPEPSPEPTPTSTPDPYVVHPDDKTQEAMLAIRSLKELYYLDELHESFDVECQYAFMEFCRSNNLPEELSVSHEAYVMLQSGKAVAAPTATPEPAVVTPEPTPVPTEVPLIYDGSSNTATVRAIMKLKELYYLSADVEIREWDSQCMVAFQQLCEDQKVPYSEEYIDTELYNWLVNSNLQPRETATPVPEITPVPEATVPPQGYSLYDTDTADSTFIADMQKILQNLNLYDPTQTKTLGMLDQPTMDAVIKYCETFGMAQTSTQVVDKAIVTDILLNGANRTPYVAPDPTMSEQLVEFLQKEALTLGDFSVKMWMLLALVVLLIFIILLIVILTNKKANDSSSASFPMKDQNRGGQAARGGSQMNSQQMVNRTPQYTPASQFNSEETMPMNGGAGYSDPDATQKLGSGINVTLNITGGPSAGVCRALISNANYIIGRPSSTGAGCDLPLAGDASVSRKHAALSYQNGQLYLFNLSSNGTRVNGQPIGDNRASAASEETMPLNSSAQRSNGGYAVKRGDMIEISSYRITVNW